MGALAPTLRDVWTYFNLVSNIVLLPMLVATFLFSKRARRHPTLVNVCMTWILSGIFSLLLFFGGQASGPEPSKALCIAQTSLLYGITPMWSVAVLVLLYHIIVVTKTPHAADKGRAKLLLMLASPYIAQCAFSIATLATSLAHPEKVTRHRRYFYCALQNSPLSNAMALFTGAVGIMISGLMVYLAVLLWRNWHGMRHAGMPSGLNLQLLLRVFIFGVYIVFGFAVNIISMVAPHNLAPDMYAATIGTVVFLVFGTQTDVLMTWCPWLRRAPPVETVYLPREANWRHTLDLMKSAVLPPEGSDWGGEKVTMKKDAWDLPRPTPAAKK